MIPEPLCSNCQDAPLALLEDGSQLCGVCDCCDACGGWPVVHVRHRLRWCQACMVQHFGLADVQAAVERR